MVHKKKFEEFVSRDFFSEEFFRVATTRISWNWKSLIFPGFPGQNLVFLDHWEGSRCKKKIHIFSLQVATGLTINNIQAPRKWTTVGKIELSDLNTRRLLTSVTTIYFYLFSDKRNQMKWFQFFPDFPKKSMTSILRKIYGICYYKITI